MIKVRDKAHAKQVVAMLNKQLGTNQVWPEHSYDACLKTSKIIFVDKDRKIRHSPI